jgi:hypothetical protein
MMHSQATASYHTTAMDGYSQSFATATPNDSRPSTSEAHNTDVDDSGIGLSMLDDSYDLKRSTGHQQHPASFMQSTGYHNTASADAMAQ